MLEEMASFFENRLAGYDEHMKTEIDGSAAFYPFTASLLPSFPGCRVLDLGCGTGLELEARYFEELRQLRQAQGLPEGLYHYDTPLTAEHEASVLREAGFTQVTELARWGATATLQADV